MGSHKVDEVATARQALTEKLFEDLSGIAKYWSDIIAADPHRFAQWCELLDLTFDFEPGMTLESLVMQYMFRPRPVYGGVQ